MFMLLAKSIYSQDNMDYLLIKYDSLGTQKWVRRFRGDWGDNKLKDMVLDKSGNIYVTGNYFNYGIGIDCMTIKYSPNGDSLWSRGYNYNSFSNDLLFLSLSIVLAMFVYAFCI